MTILNNFHIIVNIRNGVKVEFNRCICTWWIFHRSLLSCLIATRYWDTTIDRGSSCSIFGRLLLGRWWVTWRLWRWWLTVIWSNWGRCFIIILWCIWIRRGIIWRIFCLFTWTWSFTTIFRWCLHFTRRATKFTAFYCWFCFSSLFLTRVWAWSK